jgi:hypothetical protein
MFTKNQLTVVVAAVLGGFSGYAAAGAATGANQQVAMLIQQGASSWNLNLTGLMGFNAQSGSLFLAAGQLASPVSDALGQWSLSSAGSLDLDGSALASDRVKWHSWERADGTTGTTSDANNPWASVLTFTAAGNVDPFMSYGFTAKNNTATAQTYTFTMGEALVPAVAGAYSVQADVSGVIVNGSGLNVAITPVMADQDGDTMAELQVLRLSSDGGLTLVNAGVDVGQADSYSGTGGHVYGTFNSTKAGAGNYNYWMLETQFTLTPGKDVASLAGYVEISPVPEPEQLAMLLSGLGLVGWAARRRANKRQS